LYSFNGQQKLLDPKRSNKLNIGVMKSDVAKELMKRGAMFTVLSGLVAALAWPATLLSATDFIDSKWTIAVDRSACNFV
jgi:hypothetical protein